MSIRASLSQWFTPILAGARLSERVIACIGALAAIALTGLVTALILGKSPHLPLIVAPIGASAVLLFAVPSSPLAQPWQIIGGNTISAMVGVGVGWLVDDPVIASGLAVSLAILIMTFTRSLHPPGGAAALTAILGGPVVAEWGLLFPFVPVALNSCLLVAMGMLFHRLSRRSYPHVVTLPANVHKTSDPPAIMRTGFRDEDIDAALASVNETYDIDRADLARLLRQVEFESVARSQAAIRCIDIMSRDVISIETDSTPEQARQLLLKHNVRALPVTDSTGRLVGTVGLRELAGNDGSLTQILSVAKTARENDVAFGLLPSLTVGNAHAVIVIDDKKHVLGIVSQTDLLAAMAQAMPRDAG